tara:strand:- start:168 stop:413 length:246 start_codon:yes stop_codon:yes gene_type:complete
MDRPMQDTTARRIINERAKRVRSVDNNVSFQAVIDAIEDYIQVITSRQSNALDDALERLVALESDLDGIITDVKEVIEGRI